MNDVCHGPRLQLLEVAVEETLKASADPVDFTTSVDADAYDCPDGSVHSGTVATTGQDSDLHKASYMFHPDKPHALRFSAGIAYSAQ